MCIDSETQIYLYILPRKQIKGLICQTNFAIFLIIDHFQLQLLDFIRVHIDNLDIVIDANWLIGRILKALLERWIYRIYIIYLVQEIGDHFLDREDLYFGNKINLNEFIFHQYPIVENVGLPFLLFRLNEAFLLFVR